MAGGDDLAVALQGQAAHDGSEPPCGREGEAGIEGVEAAVGVEAGDGVARRASEGGEVAADERLPVGLEGQDGDSFTDPRAGLRAGGEGGVLVAGKLGVDAGSGEQP